MVATIIAAVSGDKRRKIRVIVAWHLAGLALGAALLALVVAGIASFLPLPQVVGGVALALAAALWGVSVLVGRPLPVISSAAQVPLAWRYTMTPAQYAFAYGVGLGTGVFTRIGSFSFYAFIGFMILADSPSGALLMGAAYALGRGAPVLATLVVDRSAEEIVERIDAHANLAFRADALILLGLGVALPLSVM